VKKLLGLLCVILLSVFLFGCASEREVSMRPDSHTTTEGWFVLAKDDLRGGMYDTRHAAIFGKYAPGYNRQVLEGVDTVQSTAMDGGGYFVGKDSVPTESPIGYPLKLFGKPLLDPPRTTSYCSGSSYGAFIEALNRIFSDRRDISYDRYEALRMQEENGGRREDRIKYWGKWNDDGFGSHYALVQYSRMGEEIKPRDARPGDFVNISWKAGLGHSVVFLGWYVNEKDEKCIVYWSSQKATHGYSDQVVPISRIKDVKFVRMTHPESLFIFDVSTPVNRDIPGDVVDW